MIPNETPLTAEQSAFAAEHHELIGDYLRLRRLPVDEYYDTVVFGYLRAVRRYCTMPVLHKYKFATIAYHAMMCEFPHWSLEWCGTVLAFWMGSFQERMEK